MPLETVFVCWDFWHIWLLRLTDLLCLLSDWWFTGLRCVTVYCINRYGNTVGRYGSQSHAAARLQRVYSAVRHSPEGHRPGCVSPAHGCRWHHLWRHCPCLCWPSRHTGRVETPCVKGDLWHWCHFDNGPQERSLHTKCWWKYVDLYLDISSFM